MNNCHNVYCVAASLTITHYFTLFDNLLKFKKKNFINLRFFLINVHNKITLPKCYIKNHQNSLVSLKNYE